MKGIRCTSTLFHYDGPQVMEARDGIGGHYVAVLAPAGGGAAERYLVAGVDPERLRQFRSGELDLRSLLIESEAETRYLATVEGSLDRPLVLDRLSGPLVDSGFLPDPGFFLHDGPADDSC